MCLWCLGRRDSPAIAARLVGYFNRPAREPGVLPELTDREREILALMMRGLTNGEIASTLALTPTTVRNYASNVLAKLQVRPGASRSAHADRRLRPGHNILQTLGMRD